MGQKPSARNHEGKTDKAKYLEKVECRKVSLIINTILKRSIHRYNYKEYLPQYHVSLPGVPAGVENDDPIGRHCSYKIKAMRLSPK